MHIGIDATALYGAYNGVEYALWNLLCGLNETDGRDFFSLWIPRDGPCPKELARFDARWRWHRLGFEGKDKARRIAWQQTRLPHLLKREGCGILHAPTYVAPLLCPIPVVLTVYDLIALNQPQFATRANALHYRVVLPASLRRAARVIVPSQSVARDAQKYAEREKIRVVAPGIEDIFFREIKDNEQAKTRARWNLPEEFLLFVGNWEPKKNLARLLAALEIVARKRTVPALVIAGGARAWGESFESENLDVWRIGYVLREELPALFAASTAFVFPSLAEGFGLPVLEALACGAPVVASDRVPIPHLAEAAILCNAEDNSSIARAIEKVLDDKAGRAEMARRGRILAAQYTTRAVAEATLDVYREAKGA